MSNIWNTSVWSQFVLARFPLLQGRICCSLPRLASSESSCIKFLTISIPLASSVVAIFTCVWLHVRRQLLTCTQIVAFLPGTRSPLSTQPAGLHQPWPHRVADVHWSSPRLRSARRCRLAPVHLSSLGRVLSPRWSICSSSSFGSCAFVQDPLSRGSNAIAAAKTLCNYTPKSQKPPAHSGRGAHVSFSSRREMRVCLCACAAVC